MWDSLRGWEWCLLIQHCEVTASLQVVVITAGPEVPLDTYVFKIVTSNTNVINYNCTKQCKAKQCKAMQSKAMQSKACDTFSLLTPNPRNRYMWHLCPCSLQPPATVTCDTFTFALQPPETVTCDTCSVLPQPPETVTCDTCMSTWIEGKPLIGVTPE